MTAASELWVSGLHSLFGEVPEEALGREAENGAQWCRTYRHQPLLWQHQQLTRKVRGHDAYYGVTGNLQALRRLRYEVARLWRKWLSRRSHKPCMPWARFQLLLDRSPLPSAMVYHRV